VFALAALPGTAMLPDPAPPKGLEPPWPPGA
jgi:hypothetical protein